MHVKVTATDEHEVNFVETHVGHGNELGHLNLTVSRRMEIASKIANKVSFRSILDDVRDSVSDDKFHLLTNKDLHNIAYAFHLNNSFMRHKSDAISIEAWINEVSDSGTVLYYKQQGQLCDHYPHLKDEDFVLIIMHPG